MPRPANAHRRSGRAIRQIAADYVRAAAKQRARDGDPEGAGILRMLAADIAQIRLTETPDA